MLAAFLATVAWAAPAAVSWPTRPGDDSIVDRIAPPPGTARVAAEGYSAWLGMLPLLPAGSPVLAWDGSVVRPGDSADILAVVDLDVGTRDLQQCADSILRLRAEHLWSVGEKAAIAFHFTSGDLLRYTDWASGVRDRVSGSSVQFARTAAPDASYANFRRYEDELFMYAGTRSLAREGVVATGPVEAGDFVVQAGSPGHALLVLDVAAAGDRRWVLIGEGYMPAQSFHILRGPDDGWYPVTADGLTVPTWPDAFDWSARRRFPG